MKSFELNPGRAYLAATTLLAFGLAIARLEPLNDEDVWWHIRAGQDVLAARSWHLVESASYLRQGETWINSQWLSDVIIALTANMFGLNGLIALALCVSVGVVVLLSRLILRLVGEANWLSITTLALATAGVALVPNPRPASWMVLFLLGGMLLLENMPTTLSDRRAKAWMFTIFCYQLFWSHMHDSHVLFPLLVGIHFTRLLSTPRPAREWGILLAATFSLVAGSSFLLGPLGPTLLPRLLRHWDSFATGHILEWEPITVSTLLPHALIDRLWQVLFVGAALGRLFISRRTRSQDIGQLALGLLLAASARRFMPALMILSLPLALRDLSSSIAPRKAFRVLAVALSFAALPVVWFSDTASPWPRPAWGVVTSRFPTLEMDVLTEHGARGNILNNYNDGGYIHFRLTPELHLGIDGRTPAFFDDLDMMEWSATVMSVPALDEFLQRHNVAYVILPRTTKICPFARDMPGLRLVYLSKGWGLFARDQNFLPGTDLRSLPLCEGDPPLRSLCSGKPELTETLLSAAETLERLTPNVSMAPAIEMEVAAACLNDVSRAASAARRVIERGIDRPSELELAAEIIWRSGDGAAAARALQRVPSYVHDPRHDALLGRILLSEGDRAGALRAYEAAEEGLDQNLLPSDRMNYARLLVGSRRFDAAATQALNAALLGESSGWSLIQEIQTELPASRRERILSRIPAGAMAPHYRP